MALDSAHLRTRVVHAGQSPDPLHGALTPPIYQASMFAYGDFDRGARLFAGEESGFVYSRFANPTVQALERKLAALEGTEDAIAFASGMAAISSTMTALLSPGDELVFVGPLYGGTESVLRDLLPRFGIRVVDAEARGGLAAAVGPATRLVFVETPTNPTLGIVDLAAVARIARAHGAISVADNTFATPCLTRPAELGIDLVVHSATKYLGGHGDATGGLVAGSRERLAPLRQLGMKYLGGCLSPHEAFLLLRGIKTLALRIDAACDNAERAAESLARHPKVERVHHPSLASHPGHDIARRQMARFGAILSLELRGSSAAAKAFLDGLTLITQAVSLGDTDSLACHPASTTHRGVAPEIRVRQGVSDALVRISFGIEHPDDLLADLAQALDRC